MTTFSTSLFPRTLRAARYLVPAMTLASACQQDSNARDESSTDSGTSLAETTGGGMPDESTSSDSGSDTAIVPGDGMAMVRVIHGSPESPAIDVYVAGDDSPVIAGLAYGETSTWLEVPEGTYDFEIRSADSGPADAPIYTAANLELGDGQLVSALAVGVLENGGSPAGSPLRVIPIVSGFEPAQPGEARVRIIHGGADAPAVGLDVGNDGTAEIAELERFAETGAAGVALPAGNSLQVGVLANEEPVTSFTLPALADGQHVMVIATGLLARLPRQSSGFGLLVVGDTGTVALVKQNPTVYALHAGPDAPTVDLCVGDDTISANLSFGGLTAAQVPPGSYEVDAHVAPSGCAGTPAITDLVDDLQAGQRYLVVATGELSPAAGEPPLQLQVYRENFELDQPGSSTVRLVHSASAPEVDVGIVTGDVIENGNVISPALTWPNQSDELLVEPLTYQLGFAAAGMSLPIHPLVDFHVPLEDGERAFVVAAGDLIPDAAEETFRLLLVDTAKTPWSLVTIDPNP